METISSTCLMIQTFMLTSRPRMNHYIWMISCILEPRRGSYCTGKAFHSSCIYRRVSGPKATDNNKGPFSVTEDLSRYQNVQLLNVGAGGKKTRITHFVQNLFNGRIPNYRSRMQLSTVTMYTVHTSASNKSTSQNATRFAVFPIDFWFQSMLFFLCS